jgi:hypothetical protein
VLKPPRYDKKRQLHQKFYDTADWRTTSNLLKTCNPICQRILPDGKQCEKPSTIGHHIVDPRDAPQLRLAFSNLVAVCARCHPGGAKGADETTEIYVRTIGPLEAEYKHSPDGGYPRWHKLYVASSSPLMPSSSKSTALGDGVLDAALAAYQKLAETSNGKTR